MSGASDAAGGAPPRRSAIPIADLLLILFAFSATAFSTSPSAPAATPAAEGATAAPAAEPKPGAAAATPDPAAASGDSAAAIAERHRRRDELFRKMLISPFTSLGVFPIAAHRATRIGADESGIEVDPNTRRRLVAEILVDGTGAYVTNVSSGGKLRLRRMTADGDAEPGEGTEMAGLKRLAPGEIIGLGRFIVQIAGGETAGQISLYDPEAPSKKAFTGFKWFDPDPGFQIRSVLKPIAEPDKVGIATSTGSVRDYWRIGRFEFEIAGAAQRLVAFASAAKIGRGATLFIPFRDPTNGHETYATGRYLEIRYEGTNVPHLLDFNRTINPYCSYSPWYSCPIPPKENTLSAAIRAGEMAYPHAD